MSGENERLRKELEYWSSMDLLYIAVVW